MPTTSPNTKRSLNTKKHPIKTNTGSNLLFDPRKSDLLKHFYSEKYVE